MKLNTKNHPVTHNGGKAVEINAYERLKRTVLACLLFEDNFYEDGVKAVDRIKELCTQCTSRQICAIASYAATKYHLRHVPLQLIVESLKHKDKFACLADTIYAIITRPDMMCDLLALYWKDGKKPLANKLKKGLAKAFTKFDEYSLAKYNRDNAIKLRDVLFLCHPKPINKDQEDLWKRLVNKELKTPDTWEVRLSAGEDKKESFQELLESKKMGKLAILRNLRNMFDAGISKELVGSELLRNTKEMFPFQYIAAAKACPSWEDIVDPAMIEACSLKTKLNGRTLLLIDVSGSMDQALSAKSVMSRLDAACGMAILLRECCEEISILTFSEGIAHIAPRRGMALRDGICQSMKHSSTMLGQSVQWLLNNWKHPYDRFIIITDEQSNDDIPNVPKSKNYILNIGNYQNGIGNKNQWLTISGFSEASIDYIREIESENYIISHSDKKDSFENVSLQNSQ